MKSKEWFNVWLENYVKPSAKLGTYRLYADIVEKRLAPALGEYELDELRPVVIQKLVAELLKSGNARTGKGLAVGTVNLIVTVIQAALKTAANVGEAKDYLADRIKRPRASSKSVLCFSLAEQKKIERAVLADKRRKMLGVLICLYTGLRIGELLALTWSDVDLKASTINVNKTCLKEKGVGGEQLVGTPKTESSRRTVPLPRQLLHILKEAKRASHCPYVVSAEGKPVTIRSYQRSFALLLEKLNVPHRGFHSLRHTFATRALECGMDVKTLSEILGHKSATVTLERYAHSLPEHKANMMNRLGALFCE